MSDEKSRVETLSEAATAAQEKITELETALSTLVSAILSAAKPVDTDGEEDASNMQISPRQATALMYLNQSMGGEIVNNEDGSNRLVVGSLNQMRNGIESSRLWTITDPEFVETDSED